MRGCALSRLRCARTTRARGRHNGSTNGISKNIYLLHDISKTGATDGIYIQKHYDTIFETGATGIYIYIYLDLSSLYQKTFLLHDLWIKLRAT